ncbi:MAG: EAL domain protein [Alphaproteobacteria bacterium ADurb.Bin438]|nr:MAG: EAL domain protein [Alphaproteobacteria bacterium ADurb.Bin438]
MIINKEKQLIDTLARVEKSPKGIIAIFIALSKLKGKSKNVNLNFAYKVALNISPILQTTLFSLGKGDIVLIGRNLSLTAIDDIIQKISNVLDKDMYFQKERRSLFKTYNLEFEMPIFKSDIANSINNALVKNIPNNDTKQDLSPEILNNIIRKLKEQNISETIRRQAVAKIIKGKKFEIVFKEYFLSIKHLNEILYKNVNLTENFWLFKHFTESLDLKMFEIIPKLNENIKKPKISLNLNINSVLSPEFIQFMKGKDKIIAEFQTTDILNNFSGYLKAKEILNKNGHKVLIDCVNISELEFVDLDLFKPNYVKILWNEEFLENRKHTLIKELAFKIGGKKIILSRADSDKALTFGNALGIELFQGYYVDNINAVFSKTNCKFGSKCSLAECAERKREIEGENRNKCFNLNMLDKDPSFKNNF